MSKITVFIPTYNRAELLAECLDAIAAQTLEREHFSVLVSDNASTDGTRDVVESYRNRMEIVHWQSPENLGGPVNWNKFSLALNETFACIVSDDDLMAPGFLHQARRALLDYPQAAMFCAGTLYSGLKHTGCYKVADQSHIVGSENGRNAASLVNSVRWAAISTAICPMIIIGTLFRSSALAQFSPIFDPNITYPDWWTLARIGATQPVVVSPWPLALMRLHGNNGTMRPSVNAHLQIGALALGQCEALNIDVVAFWAELERAGQFDDALRQGVFNCYPHALRKTILGNWRPRQGKLDSIPMPEKIGRASCREEC